MPKRPAKIQKTKKMIQVRVEFWTNVAPEKGKLVPKHAWASGMVRLEPNKLHGIGARTGGVPFHSLLGLGQAVEAVLIRNGIMLHIPRVERKYRAA